LDDLVLELAILSQLVEAPDPAAFALAEFVAEVGDVLIDDDARVHFEVEVTAPEQFLQSVHDESLPIPP
jgi:hypothetical protein